VKDSQEIVQVHSAVVEVNDHLLKRGVYKTLIWSDVSKYSVSEAGVAKAKRHIKALYGNMSELASLAGSRDWTKIEKHCLRMYYRANRRLCDQASEALDNIERVLVERELANQEAELMTGKRGGE